MENIRKPTWESFKTLVQAKGLRWQFDESSIGYAIFAIDSGVIYSYRLAKESPPSADQTDFETNFKPAANAPVVQSTTVRSISTDGLTVTSGFVTRSDTFTSSGAGVAAMIPNTPAKSYGVQVTGTLTAANNWDVSLQGSLDGVSFSEILNHKKSIGNGEILWSGSALSPALQFRSFVNALNLGDATNVVVTIIGVP